MSSQYKHIQLRRGKQSAFHQSNPVLKEGEPAFAVDVGQLKIGDGKKPWSELPSFHNNVLKSVSVDIPAIQANTSETVAITVADIDARNTYAVLVVPDSILPDYVTIRYAYVSNDNEVSVVLTNVDNSAIDGNEINNYSPATSDVKLSVVIYFVNIFSETVITTTTPDPVVDDVLSYGYNEFGQLSLSDNLDKLQPTLVFDNGKKWSTFELGNYHTLALDYDKILHSCGYNYYGQLGIESNGVGTNIKDLSEIQNTYFKNGEVFSSGYPIKQTWSRISAGSHHSLAIDSSGNLFSCGDGSYGALGLEDTNARDAFTIIGKDVYFVDLNRLTENGINSVDNRFTLNDININANFIANNGKYIVSGISPSNAISLVHNSTADIIAYSGGVLEQTINNQRYYSDYLLIDVSGDYNKASLTSLNGSYLNNGQDILYYKSLNGGWQEVSAGNHHSLGIKNNELYTWGNNSFGQLGDGDHRDVHVPQKITDKNDWVQVKAGNSHSLALDSNGDIYAFGNNQYGQLGIGSVNHADIPTKINFDFSQIQDVNFTYLPSGSYVDVQEYNHKQVYVLDYTQGKQYNPLERFVLSSGQYIIYNVPQSDPIAILNRGKTNTIKYNGDINGGCLNLVNTTADGTYNFYYGNVYIDVLGNFDKVSIYSYNHGYMGGKNLLFYEKPNYVIEDISAGANHSLIKTDTDQVLSFGRNHKGQLGTGDNLDRSVPFRLSESNIEKISTGANHSQLVDNQHYIWSFGDNDRGQLGLGDRVPRNLPSQMQSPIRWQNTFNGGDHSYSTVLSYFPNVPTNLNVENANTSNIVGNRQLLVSWSHETALQEAVTHYVIEYSIDNGVTWSVYSNNALSNNFNNQQPQVSNLSFILDGLNNSESYLVRIAGVNRVGKGQYTSTSQPISPEEATDGLFDSVILYSHFDNSLDDLSNNSYPYDTSFLTNIDSEGTRYLDGAFSECLRLYRYDSMRYDTSFNLDGEYTIEFFFNPRNRSEDINANPSGNPIITLNDSNSNQYLNIMYYGNDTTGYDLKIFKTDGTNLINIQDYNFNGFDHIALTRTSGIPDNPSSVELLQLYIDGNVVASGRDSSSYVIDSVLLGSGQYFHDFEIDELRLSSGIRYDNNFTPTTKPFGIGLS